MSRSSSRPISAHLAESRELKRVEKGEHQEAHAVSILAPLKLVIVTCDSDQAAVRVKVQQLQQECPIHGGIDVTVFALSSSVHISKVDDETDTTKEVDKLMSKERRTEGTMTSAVHLAGQLVDAVAPADIILIALSTDFAVTKLALQALIYLKQTVRKPTRYFNLLSTYGDLVNGVDFKNSDFALLLGNAFVHASLEEVWVGWVSNYRNVTSSRQAAGQGSKTADKSIICGYIVEDADVAEVSNICKDMENTTEFTFRRENDPSSGLSDAACILVFPTYKFAQNQQCCQLLTALIDKTDRPMVTVVVNPSSKDDPWWSKTGLGLLLANELYVDFSRKDFYLPGDSPPSRDSKLQMLAARIREVCLMMVAKNSSSDSMSEQNNGGATVLATTGVRRIPSAFASYAMLDTTLTWEKCDWPLAAHDNESMWSREKPHDVMRYVSYFYNEGILDIQLDRRIRSEPEEYWEKAAQHCAKADIQLQFWSNNYIKRFYPYSEVSCTLLLHCKTIIIVWLDEVQVVLTTLKTMPRYEGILSKLLQLSEISGAGYSKAPNLYGVPTRNVDFSKVCEIVKGIVDAHAAVDTVVTIPRSPPSASCDVLISYCWNNSRSAYEAGRVSSFVGHTDPIYIKQHLEAAGLTCWLDVEQLGADGLYKGIRKGLSSVKFVLLCISDDYAQSPNCMMELENSFRKLPCAVAKVGYGYSWQDKPAGYLTASFQSFDFVHSPYPGTPEGQYNFLMLEKFIRMRIGLKVEERVESYCIDRFK